jgi:hypothetical protein
VRLLVCAATRLIGWSCDVHVVAVVEFARFEEVIEVGGIVVPVVEVIVEEGVGLVFV